MIIPVLVVANTLVNEICIGTEVTGSYMELIISLFDHLVLVSLTTVLQRAWEDPE